MEAPRLGFIESERRIVGEIAQLGSKDALSNWLWHTLQLHYFPKLRNEKEQIDFKDYWRVHDAPIEGMRNIYCALRSEEQKLWFRQSIGEELTKHANDKDVPLDMLRDLIYLTAATRAVESVGVFLPLIGNGPLGKKPRVFLTLFPLSKVYLLLSKGILCPKDITCLNNLCLALILMMDIYSI